jgi:hypothetical protein
MADMAGLSQPATAKLPVNAVAGPSRSPRSPNALVATQPSAQDTPQPASPAKPVMERSTTGDDVLGIPSLPTGDELEEDVPAEVDVPDDFVDRADDFDMRTSMYVRAFEGASRPAPPCFSGLATCALVLSLLAAGRHARDGPLERELPLLRARAGHLCSLSRPLVYVLPSVVATARSNRARASRSVGR